MGQIVKEATNTCRRRKARNPKVNSAVLIIPSRSLPLENCGTQSRVIGMQGEWLNCPLAHP